MSEIKETFDQRHLDKIQSKMDKLRSEIEILSEIKKRSESEFKKLQSEYFSVQKIINEDANIPAD